MKIAVEAYIISNPLSLVLYARISIAVYGKYRFTYYPLIHRRRDDGSPSPQRFFQNRGKVGMDGEYRGATSFFIQISAEPGGGVGVCGDYSVRIKNVIKEILYYGT